MQQTPASLQDWDLTPHSDIGEDHIAFLKLLKAPTCISIKGLDSSRSRAIVTLLHGNEPSGLKAVHQLLKEKVVPTTDLLIVIASINAALHPPLLSHRYLPWERDLNRCFGEQRQTNQQLLAAHIAERIHAENAEAVIDTHNTSAHSEPFAVAYNDHSTTLQIAQMFTHNLVVIDKPMGTLIEQTTGTPPIVTVEFGGFMDPNADQLAFETLSNFIMRDNLFIEEPGPIKLLHHPLRLEIDHEYRLHYSSSVQNDSDLTMINTIDQLNFQLVKEGTRLGWLGKNGLQGLNAISAAGHNLVGDYFQDIDGFLTTRHDMTLFMATTDPYIASNDCLLYFTPVRP